MIRALRLRRAVLQPADLLSDWTAAGVLSEELRPLLQADRGLADWRTGDAGPRVESQLVREHHRVRPQPVHRHHFLEDAQLQVLVLGVETDVVRDVQVDAGP